MRCTVYDRGSGLSMAVSPVGPRRLRLSLSGPRPGGHVVERLFDLGRGRLDRPFPEALAPLAGRLIRYLRSPRGPRRPRALPNER
jgi:hypothetical protein